MNWYIELHLLNGDTDKMYCVSREEARERARFYRTMCEHGQPGSVVQATVRKVG